MEENKIELKSVSELLGMKFFIPNYQRGYGATQGIYALETCVNELADILHIDPVEIREKNMVRQGQKLPGMLEGTIQKIKEMIDVNSVVGQPITTPDGVTIIPVSKVSVVIVQCRLSSTRLPGKALKKLGDKTVLEWTLNAMKKVKATSYYLATDEDSKSELEPIARKCGWDFFAGSLNDVLDRFCRVIEISKADVVVVGMDMNATYKEVTNNE